MPHPLAHRRTPAGRLTSALGPTPAGRTCTPSSVAALPGAHGLDADASGSLVAPDAGRDEPAAAVVGAAAAEIDLARGSSRSTATCTRQREPSVTVVAGRASTTCPGADGDGDTTEAVTTAA